MTPALSQPLLESGPRLSRRRALLGALAGGLTLASPGIVAQLRSSRASRGPLGLAAFPSDNGTECWQMTGGTCNVLGCDATRGRAQCYSSGYISSHFCVCEDGYCSGADGTCYPKRNKLIASNLTLSAVVKGKDYYLVSTSCVSDPSSWLSSVPDTSTKVSTDGSGSDARWSLWQFPGGYTAYMLVPETDPDCVLTVKSDDQGYNLFQTMGPWHWGLTAFAHGPNWASFKFDKVEGGRYTLQLANIKQGMPATSEDGSGLFLYVTNDDGLFRSLKKATIYDNQLRSTMGLDGQWKVTPPLPGDVGKAEGDAT